MSQISGLEPLPTPTDHDKLIKDFLSGHFGNKEFVTYLERERIGEVTGGDVMANIIPSLERPLEMESMACLIEKGIEFVHHPVT